MLYENSRLACHVGSLVVENASPRQPGVRCC